MLKNKDFYLSDGIIEYIKSHVALPAQPAAELLVKYYFANKPHDSDKVVLPVTNQVNGMYMICIVLTAAGSEKTTQ